MNEQQILTILNPRSFAGIFSDYGRYSLQTVSFLEGKNQNTNIKTESYVFSGFGNGISRRWERKSSAGRFATGRLWLCTQKISSIDEDKVNNWEFCILKITPILFL